MTNHPLLKVAVILGPHGVRGQVKLRSFLEKPAAIFSLDTISDEKGTRKFQLKKHGIQGEVFIASLGGIEDRNAAEKLKGKALYAPTNLLPPKPENAWYYDELIGLRAMLKNGKTYGRIVSVVNFGAGDIIEIEKLDATLEMLPLNDDFVGKIDVANGVIEVFPPEYVIVEEKP